MYRQEKTLEDKLLNYSLSTMYPFHMPGHKRNIKEMAGSFPNPFSIDITEIEGFDDLHHAEGILHKSMTWAAKIYGSDESDYLVNGSSCGILSAVSGCVSCGEKILISRNCHKSVYHAVFLNQLQTEYVYPQFVRELGIQGGILPEDVENILAKNPDIHVVVIVSPTYDGIVSDIERISQTVHQHGGILIVDEAHGAHFPFGKEGGFPESALKKGADVVIQSLHKTLPSLTQTAIIHCKKKYLGQNKMDKIRWYLSVYQTSSPSYVFLASIENCLIYMEKNGRERLSWVGEKLKDFRRKCQNLSCVSVPGREWIGKYGIYDFDASKILILSPQQKVSGEWIGRFLRERHHIELEMLTSFYALALTSVMDQEEGFIRLFAGLKDMEKEILKEGYPAFLPPNLPAVFNNLCLKKPDILYSINQALEKPTKICRLEEGEGKISAGFVALYPPGIPCLVPGERISKDIIIQIKTWIKAGLTVYGIPLQVIHLSCLSKPQIPQSRSGVVSPDTEKNS